MVANKYKGNNMYIFLQKSKGKLFLFSIILSSTIYADISGSAYRDYNLNNVKETLEPGVKNIKVTGYDNSGTIKTTTTDANGAYTLSGLSGSVRVEFSNLPGYLKDGVAGNRKNTSVQFANDGDTIDFALHNPAEYVGDISKAKIVATTLIGGSQTNDTTKVLPSIRVFDYAPNDSTNNDDNVANISLIQDTGNVWGLAYSAKDKKLYSSALLKRHASV
jgi:hypothetical protein